MAIDVDVIGYCRVSTDEQARTGLGLAAQRSAISAEADRRGWRVTWLTDEGYSAKDLNRPAIQDALGRLENGGPRTLVVARLDRLSRSLLDFAGLVERARRKGWALVALDLGVDTTTPSGELMASVVASVAQYERRLIAQRTREALAAAKARGQRLGRPVVLPAATRDRVAALRETGLSLQAVADALTAEGLATACGGTWHGSTVAAVLRSAALDEAAERAAAS